MVSRFSSGSTALVSLALFGSFMSSAGISTDDVLNPKVFIGLIVDAMLPSLPLLETLLQHMH
ncbi:hypothetical protein SADUNF_Sadunf03G0017600 [Salix dunnii]|uniref:H(+)-exporting diphosphatase n=1 Tax=Salix dunnii TaxID=1413687 RepID=A0A835N1J0_9ROSI|nr:hypothetical protein SADUNF_Sadunf03G0017600 [Salix dunnii]